MLRLLAKADLTYGDIVPIYLSPADASAALSRGDVDAWVFWDPFFAQAEHRQKMRAIATTKDIVNGNSVYVANPDSAARDWRRQDRGAASAFSCWEEEDRREQKSPGE